MTKEIMRQKATENPYLHKDFHIAFNYAIDYLYKKFGREAVREYLIQFATVYYSPLKSAIKEKGLQAIKEHYKKVYEIESAEFDINLSCNELIINLSASPAIIHIKNSGHPVSEVYSDSVATVIETICMDTPIDVELLEYHEHNGAYRIRFFRRQE